MDTAQLHDPVFQSTQRSSPAASEAPERLPSSPSSAVTELPEPMEASERWSMEGAQAATLSNCWRRERICCWLMDWRSAWRRKVAPAERKPFAVERAAPFDTGRMARNDRTCTINIMASVLRGEVRFRWEMGRP